VADAAVPDTRVATLVADADVLAADLLVGGPPREALDLVRQHSWIDLVASDALVDDAQAVITRLADAQLATDWRATIDDLRVSVSHPAGDHPGLASAYHGDAAHVLTCNEGLQRAQAGVSIRDRMDVSVKSPDAFVSLFDPAEIYPLVVGGEYPGPDRHVRDG
jgi:hypothetical protein